MKKITGYLSLMLLGFGAACFAGIENRFNITFKNNISYKDHPGYLKLTCTITPALSTGLNKMISKSTDFNGKEVFSQDFSSLLKKWSEGKQMLESSKIPLEISFSFSVDAEKLGTIEGRTLGDVCLAKVEVCAMCKRWDKVPTRQPFAGINSSFTCIEPYASKPFTITFDPTENRIHKHVLQVSYVGGGFVDGGLKLEEAK